MARGYQKLEINPEEVRVLMNNSNSKDEFRRYQALYLRVSEKMSAHLIAKITCFSISHIHSIHSFARNKGITSLASAKKGGRNRSYLTIEEERQMLNTIEKTAIKGGVVEIGKVHKLFEEKVGCKVARFTAYRLLHRHGWRKIVPRPYHPNQKADAVETFKKTGQFWSKVQD
ncbi:winged helix-turn-helix domain-containing protein [Candidatus Tisiphia endosymbiont of Mystacides longicornis]|uniref:winged helix-turn-helix domain-containing protein n=1 Tax=Candidatus Tisiphia endosymbiont of Mystacides longicornis TaxID=3139330 RepID=UPI003CCA9FC1